MIRSTVRRNALSSTRRRYHATPLRAAVVKGWNGLEDGPEQLPPAPPSIPPPMRTIAPQKPKRPNYGGLDPRRSPLTPEEEVLETVQIFLLRVLAQLTFAARQGDPSTFVDLPTIYRDLTSKDGKVIDRVLRSEPAPNAQRRMNVAPEDGDGVETILDSGEQSGICTIALVHFEVKEGKTTNYAFCTGFCISEAKDGEGALVVTSSEALSALEPRLNESSKSSSAILVISSSGHIFPVTSLASSLTSSELLVLSLAPEPVRDPVYALKNANSHSPSSPSSPSSLSSSSSSPVPSSSPPRSSFPKLKSLPISLYPAPNGTKVASFRYEGPMVRSDGGVKKNRYEHGVIKGYRDPIGREAETGSYDELAKMELSTNQPIWSTGGPVIDVETGSVVGILKESLIGPGIAVPAEKIFELFKLADFVPKSARTREEEAAATATHENKVVTKGDNE